MAEIKPAEISAILKNNLSGFESGASLEEVGTVLQVGDGIARVYGFIKRSIRRVGTIRKRIRSYRIELRRRQCRGGTFGPSTGIKKVLQ